MYPTRIAHTVHVKTFAAQSIDHAVACDRLVNSTKISQTLITPDMYACMFHLIALQLKEIVEIVGVQGRAQLRRCGSLAETEIRVGRVGFGSECVKGAGLVGVL